MTPKFLREWKIGGVVRSKRTAFIEKIWAQWASGWDSADLVDRVDLVDTGALADPATCSDSDSSFHIRFPSLRLSCS